MSTYSSWIVRFLIGLVVCCAGNKILYGWPLKLLIGGDWIWAGEYNFSWILVKLWFVAVSSISAAVVVGSFMGYRSEIVCVSLSEIVGTIKPLTHANFPFVLKLPMNWQFLCNCDTSKRKTLIWLCWPNCPYSWGSGWCGDKENSFCMSDEIQNVQKQRCHDQLDQIDTGEMLQCSYMIWC